MTAKKPSSKQLRWRRNKAAERARKAHPAPPAPPPEVVEEAHEYARKRVRAAVMPEMESLIPQIAKALREEGQPFNAQDVFSIWYHLRHDPTRPNFDIWRLSESARDFTIEVWAARIVIERQHGAGKATAGKIASHLTAQGQARAYTKGSLRVMVWRALDRIRRIEGAEQNIGTAQSDADDPDV